MWFKEESKYSKKRYANRRLREVRNPILMVSARASDQRSVRMHRFGAIILLTVVLAGTAWVLMASAQFIGQKLFSHNDRFLIEKLEIASDGRLSAGIVKEFAKVSEGMNLFAVDLQQVRDDLKGMPIVSSVEVRRKLPDTLELRIRERSAAARLGDENTGYPLAMDFDGVVLGPSSVSPNLPFIAGFRNPGLRPGVRVDDPAVKTALRVLELCDMPFYSRLVRVQKIDVSHAEFLDIRLRDGERVLLSRDGVEGKLTSLCEIIKYSADMGKAIAAVDMTVDKNFPVTYR